MQLKSWSIGKEQQMLAVALGDYIRQLLDPNKICVSGEPTNNQWRVHIPNVGRNKKQVGVMYHSVASFWRKRLRSEPHGTDLSKHLSQSAPNPFHFLLPPFWIQRRSERAEKQQRLKRLYTYGFCSSLHRQRYELLKPCCINDSCRI